MIEQNCAKKKNNSLNFVSPEGDVYILGDFDDSISEYVIPEMNRRIEELTKEKIPLLKIYINSFGGWCHILFSLLSLIEIAKSKGVTVATINLGSAYSCGSLLAVVGDYRLMYKYATNLMHYGSQGGIQTTPLQIERYQKQADEHFKRILDIYKTHTKLSEKKIKEILKDDGYYLNAEDCVKFGLADDIIGQEKQEEILEMKVKNNSIINVNNRKVKIIFKEEKKKKEEKSVIKEEVKKSRKKKQKEEGN